MMADTFRGVNVPKAWLELKGARDICEYCRELEGITHVRALGSAIFCILCLKDRSWMYGSPVTVRLEMVW